MHAHIPERSVREHHERRNSQRVGELLAQFPEPLHQLWILNAVGIAELRYRADVRSALGALHQQRAPRPYKLVAIRSYLQRVVIIAD